MTATAIQFAIQNTDDRQGLARALRRRDPDVLDALIQQYQYRLFRYLLYLTSSRETAEDVFQETWIRVLDRGHQYDGESRFETWLFAIGRHLVLDLHRRRKPESLDSLTEGESAAAEPSPLDLATIHQLQAGIRASLDQLPAVYREVLVLRFQEDLSLEEISAVINAPLSTAKSRLYRGLAALREVIEGRKS